MAVKIKLDKQGFLHLAQRHKKSNFSVASFFHA